jgi:N-acetylglucosamine-6-phosphate deacetylase
VPPLAIRAARALTPLEEIADALLLIEEGRIAAIGPRAGLALPPGTREVDATRLTAVPGFVDVHIHGAAGHDVMEATPEALSAVARCVARRGTTGLVATTVSAAVDRTLRSLEGLAHYIRTQPGADGGAPPGAAAAEYLGIHLEGPFLSVARRGVHPAGDLLVPSPATLARFITAAQGYADIVTLAPELPRAGECIAAACAAGLVAAIGHTDALYSESQRAIELGARHAVHLFNAMRPFSHRETGVLGAVLTDRRVTVELIADGVHVDDPAIRLVLAAKGVDRVLLVTDGTAATGMPDGSYQLGTIPVTVSGGVCRNAEGKLAGSTLTLDRAVRHMTALGVPLGAALQMATLNPARLLGLETRKGVLASGADADILLLGPSLSIAQVYVRGQELL